MNGSLRAISGARRYTLAAVAGLLLAVAAGPARAADPLPGATADALFREGRARLTRGDASGAVTLFLESQRLQPAAGTLLNLAIAEEKLGQRVNALGHARAALDQLPAADPRYAIARSTFESLDAAVPRLTIVAATELPVAAHVELDGLTLAPGTLGVPLPVEVGSHRVKVMADGYESTVVSRVVALGARETVRVELGRRVASDAAPGEPPAEAREVTPPPAPPSASDNTLRVVGFVAFGTGLAGLAVAGVTGALALGRKSVVDAHCNNTCDAVGSDASSAGRSYATVATVAGVAGGLLTIGGIVLVVVAPPRGRTRAGTAEVRVSGSAVRVAIAF